MKSKIIIIVMLCTSIFESMAQTTLEKCYSAARDNYPLITQYNLIEQTTQYNLRNASTARLPQLGLSARATYQSAVTSVPISTISALPKDQYQIIAEINQTIWDGGAVGAQKRGVRAAAEVDSRKVDVDIYALIDRVNNLFFGILMLDGQLRINEMLDAELNRNLRKVESYVDNGVANDADVDAVKVEILNNRQNRDAIEAARSSYAIMLSQMVGFEIGELVMPQMPDTGTWVSDNCRPEIYLYDAQIQSIDLQKQIIKARNMPKLGLFIQGAYGNPGLDMLKAGFTPYAIGGVRLSWNFSGLYTRKNELANIELAKETVWNQRAIFDYNNNLQVTQTAGELDRILKQMEHDDQIISLRGNIKRAAEAKVEGGTMSVNDMLREVTAENTARLTKAIHEIELLKAFFEQQYNINPNN